MHKLKKQNIIVGQSKKLDSLWYHYVRITRLWLVLHNAIFTSKRVINNKNKWKWPSRDFCAAPQWNYICNICISIFALQKVLSSSHSLPFFVFFVFFLFFDKQTSVDEKKVDRLVVPLIFWIFSFTTFRDFSLVSFWAKQQKPQVYM